MYYDKKKARLHAISRENSNRNFNARLSAVNQAGLYSEWFTYRDEHKSQTLNMAMANFCRIKNINI